MNCSAMEVKPDVRDPDTIMLTELIYQADVLGKRAQNGFKPEAWKTVVAKLEANGIIRDVKTLKERNRYVDNSRY